MLGGGGGDGNPASGGGPYRAGGERHDDRALIRRMRRGDAAARAELIERYLPLAIRLAQRYRPANDTADDLVQVASLGLVNAIDRYDPDREVSLSSYAVPTILGELKRHFRDRGWAVRVPRDLQELALRVLRANDALGRRLGRSPTAAELADELGVTAEQVVEAQEAATAYSSVPLDPPAEPDDEEPRRRRESSLGGVDPGYRLVEQRVLLGALMEGLSAREREILRLRFMEDLTQSEIGARLGLSQMHVSRLIRRSLELLRRAAQSSGSS